jgi:S1-C subfamily serine protease
MKKIVNAAILSILSIGMAVCGFLIVDNYDMMAKVRSDLAALSASYKESDLELSNKIQEIKNHHGWIRTEMMQTAVIVNTEDGGGGSGVVVYSYADGDKYITYVLTAKHVIENRVAIFGDLEQDGWEPYLKGQIEFKNGDRENFKTLFASNSSDLAILIIEGLTPRTPARLALEPPKMVSEVFAIGAPWPLLQLLVTDGLYSGVIEEDNGEVLWHVSTPITYGNSGGGVFSSDNGCLVGIAVRICIVRPFSDAPVYHEGLMVPLEEVVKFLDLHDIPYWR